MSMIPIVELSAQDIADLIERLDGAYEARVAIDGGVKISVERRMWTLPYGTIEETR